MKMEDKIISFETAKLAKEKKFDWKCLNIVDNQEFELLNPYYSTNSELQKTACTRPTQSLLQKYLREVHNIHLYVWVKHGDSFKIVLINNKQNPYFFNEEYKSYEEALEIGLQEGLKLIKQK